MADDYELMVPRGGEWFELYQRQAWGDPPRVFVRRGEVSGRGGISALLVVGTGEALVDAATIKAVPIANVEAIVNHPDFAKAITPDERKTLDAGGHFVTADLDRLDRAMAAVLENSTPVARRERFLQRMRRAKRPQLTRPDGADPEGFSQRVADAYHEAVLTTSKPAVALAEEAGVPVTTVHRWIREARQRGLIAPARKGRAG